jgi:hypothetical protein
LRSNGSLTQFAATERCPFGTAGDVPVIGVWNAGGQDEVGVYRPSEGRFYLDLDDSRTWVSEDLMTEPLATFRRPTARKRELSETAFSNAVLQKAREGFFSSP